MRRHAVTPLLLMLAALAAPAAAQQVDVQLREQRSRTPIIGAIVRLLGETDDRIHAQGLSNEGGRISLRAPTAGRYRLKVDRIGWVGLITPSFALDAGQIFPTEVLLGDVRLDLPTIEVQGENVCGRRFDGDTEAANLWQEIDRALTATVISQREAVVPLHLREFHRELRLNGRVEREWFTRSAIVRGAVYQTLPPPLLATEGFVLVDNQSDSTIYAVPDAALLVSPEFTETHCFRTVRERDGRIGLYFEPIPRRQVTDIQGTIWLDPASHELRYLEYTYTGLPPLPQRVDFGGRVEFERLPSGRWIVSDWHVRTPLVGQVTVRTRGLPGYRSPTMEVDRMTGFLELGGRVRIASDPSAIVTQAILVGRVVDPVTGEGLAGARVSVTGVPTWVSTDESGRFSLATPLYGERMAAVSHPRFRLSSRPTDRLVLLSVGDTTTVDFHAPTMPPMVRAVCGNPRNHSGIVGVVLDAAGEPIPNAQVRASWRQPTGELRQERIRSGPAGDYGFCNLPPDEEIEITLTGPDGQVVRRDVELAPREFQWVELRVGGRTGPAGAP
ncbi:MAG: carboxypeptidase regulatory-like domain-containing protein [Gemmatimonadales bacterium]